MSKQDRARTRDIRHRMNKTGEPYTQAARAVGGTEASTSKTDRLGTILRCLLVEAKASRSTEEAEIAKEEALGHRIVDGGNTGPITWAIIDWRTQKLIAEGAGGHDGYEQALDRLDPNGTWSHIDGIRDKQLWSAPSREHLPGIPDSLVEHLDDWLNRPTTLPDEVAALVGWTERRVLDHLGEE